MNWSRWKRGALHAWIVVQLYFIMMVTALILINLILFFNRLNYEY